MPNHSAGNKHRSQQAGAAGYVENDPGLVRQRPGSATVDAQDQLPPVVEQDDPTAQWNDNEHLDEPILLQAQRLLESAGSRGRALAAVERAAERKEP